MTQPVSPVYGEYLLRPKVLGQVAVVRKDIALGQSELVGIQISDGTALIDPEAITASVYKRDQTTDTDDPLGLLAVTYPVNFLTHEDTGIYSFSIPAEVTQLSGLVNIVWNYTFDSRSFTHKDYYSVSEEMPYFSGLTIDERGVVDRAILRFADLYDSFDGGPHLKEEFQTHFSKERVAILMGFANNALNFQNQPATRYIVGNNTGTRFPVKNHGILEWATYIEMIKHLIRSYTEQPLVTGANVAITDRRDYTNRWREVLKDELDRFNAAVAIYKRSLIGLGGGSLLVSGGIYGPSGMWKASNGYYTAALRGFSRNYPISYVVSTGM